MDVLLQIIAFCLVYILLYLTDYTDE